MHSPEAGKNQKTRVRFPSADVRCAGYLYHPWGDDRDRPCVVMANGFSGTMDWILPGFAERFATAGFAVLVFDYRRFGESEGEPRQIVDVREQRSDLRNAVDFARGSEGIDPERIVLWGTSLGGSHVVELAAGDPSLAAVICNVPALDALRGAEFEAKRRKAGVSRLGLVAATLALLVAAALDALKGALGLTPLYLRVYGEPGRAFFTDPALSPRFRAVETQSASWENRVAARFLLQAPRYRPGTMERITAPLLVCLAEHDMEVSSAFVKERARLAPRAEIREYPVEHFEMYHGETFERVVADQIDFLRRHVGQRWPSSTPRLP